MYSRQSKISAAITGGPTNRPSRPSVSVPPKDPEKHQQKWQLGGTADKGGPDEVICNRDHHQASRYHCASPQSQYHSLNDGHQSNPAKQRPRQPNPPGPSVFRLSCNAT